MLEPTTDITKPFGVNELLARVRAALRRASFPLQPETSLIEVGDFRIDVLARSVHVRKCEVRLTPKEFELLVHLARHPGKVNTHRSLLAAVWGPNSVEQPEYLRVFVGTREKSSNPTKVAHGTYSLNPGSAIVLSLETEGFYCLLLI